MCTFIASDSLRVCKSTCVHGACSCKISYIHLQCSIRSLLLTYLCDRGCVAGFSWLRYCIGLTLTSALANKMLKTSVCLLLLVLPFVVVQ